MVDQTPTMRVNESTESQEIPPFDPRVVQLLVKRKEDYQLATMFFKEKGDRKKTLRLLEQTEVLNSMINLAEKGVKPDKSKLPAAVTPAIVLGYDEAERIDKFNSLIQEFNDEFVRHK